MKSYKSELIDARNLRFSPEQLRLDPHACVRHFSEDVDKMLREVYSAHFDELAKNVTLVALGGYGRYELCPGSDIDLLVLHEGDHKQEKIERFIRALWDMGFPLGCVVRNVNECRRITGEDLATDTALLDCRYLVGDRHLYRELEILVIQPYFNRRKQWFVQEMDTAVNGAITIAGTLLYAVNPDLKNGVCTLRDCQRIRWARRVYDGRSIDHNPSADQFYLEKGEELLQSAFYSLLAIRSALHMVAARRIDVLDFNYQADVSEYLGLGRKNPELLMEKYFRTVRDVKTSILYYFEQKRDRRNLFTRIRSTLSALQVARGIYLLDGIFWDSGVAATDDTEYSQWIIELFMHALTYKATLSTALLGRVRTFCETSPREKFIDKKISSQFLTILSSMGPIEPVIHLMHETGFLEKLIPEFESIRCKVEYDSYHEFTVDQHTLLALYTLDELRMDSRYKAYFESVDDIVTLRMAVLLHDIGKSLDGNHCYNSAVMVTTICDRLELSEARKNDIQLLVHHHLELSTLTFQREPELEVLKKFIENIGSVRLLDMLYLLTVADIKSVGRKTWTGWKGAQLEEIYDKIKMMLDGKVPTEGDLLVPVNEKIRNVIDEIRDVGQLSILLEPFPGYERLTFCAIDRARLFADMAGSLSSEGYNILNAQITTTADGKAIDIFTVEPDTTTRIPSEKRIDKIQKKWEKISSGAIKVDDLIRERVRLYPPEVVRQSAVDAPEIRFDNTISRDCTVIEIHSDDRIGLLYNIASVFDRLEINIVSAKLSTRGRVVADVFYVNSSEKKKIGPSKFEQIKALLFDTIR
jgi:[protein-PII] uridylyltransferase